MEFHYPLPRSAISAALAGPAASRVSRQFTFRGVPTCNTRASVVQCTANRTSRSETPPAEAATTALDADSRGPMERGFAVFLSGVMALALSLPCPNAVQAALPQEVTTELARSVGDEVKLGLKALDSRLSSMLGSLTESMPLSSTSGDNISQSDAEILINEVWEVVDDHFLDARESGWSRDRWRDLRDRALEGQYADSAAVHRAVRDMLSRGVADPYTRFITPGEFEGMKKYDVTRVGLNLGTAAELVSKTGLPLPAGETAESSGIWVLGLIKGSISEIAGVQQGDRIVEIDGVDQTARSPFEVASLIQQGPEDSAGPASSTVQLKVQRANGDTATVEFARPAATLETPVSMRVDRRPGGRKVGTIRLTSFNALAQRDVAIALKKLEEAGVTEYVLDVRDNRGGLVQEGIEVAALFMDGPRTAVITEIRGAVPGSDPKSIAPTLRTVTRTSDTPALTDKPLTVLINGSTASASEIMSGALRDNCRAVLVGKRSFGKGLIQSVYELSDSSGLVLTVGKYLTPNEIDIDIDGIQPDFREQPTNASAAQVIKACLIK